MRVINPETGGTAGRTRTMTTRLVALRPSLTDLIDAGFLVVLTLVGLLGFASSFDSPRFFLVGLLGLVLGVLYAHISNVLRWHWSVPLLAVAVTYLLVGGVLGMPETTVIGFIPSVSTFADLSLLVVNGWKELLTTLPPLSGDSPQTLLIFLLALVAGAVGFSVARRSRSTWSALISPLVVLAGSILLGTYEPAAAVPQGLGFAAVGFGWMAVRAQRRRRLVGTGSTSLVRLGLGAVVLVVATAIGLVAGPVAAGNGTRTVLRSYVVPPVELPSYTSPLVGFPKYSDNQPTTKRFYDQTLATVTSSAPLARLRLAVLDDYSGTAWDGLSGGGGTALTAFQRVNTNLPVKTTGPSMDATVSIDAAYASIPELQSWVPSIGTQTTLSLDGTDAQTLRRSLRYNLTTGQALVSAGLRAGDTVTMTGTPVATLPDGAIAPGSGSVVTAANYQFINEYLSKLITQPDATPGDQLREAMAFLKQGYYSDGTRQGEIGRYASGHDRHRLQVFLAGDQLVGSDEQYAATLGLVAAQLGFPSRVVFGANVPAGGVVKGSDVTAWVEVELSDGQWYTIAPSTFIPDRERRPDQIPPPQYQDARAKVVPPPNPVRPPGSLDSWLEADNANSDSGFFGQFWRILLAILRWVGPPALVIGAIVGALLGAKALRRRRRRRHGAFTTRVAAGWREALDRTRDLGVSVPVEATRQEQVLVIGRGELQPLADDADRLIFGPGDPDEDAVGGYWAQVDQLRRDSVAGLPWWRRWLVALNPLSLLPGRVSQRVGAISVSNLPWRRLGAA